MDDRFRLLTGGSKLDVARHQTLAASVEWSHDLLDDAERILFRRLSVFAGGFSLDAAEAVGAGNGIEPLQVLDLLTGLVDKSLVVADEDCGGVRYRLLETIRQFASARLEASGETAAVRDAHLAVQLHLAGEAERELLSDDERLSMLEAEHDNLRTALEWALSRSDLDDAIHLVVGLASLWLSRGLLREAVVWFDRVLDHPEATDSSLHYRGVWARGMLALIDGRPDPALGMAAEAADAARAASDHRYVARCLTVHGAVQTMLDPAAAEKILDEAVSLGDDSGDRYTSVMARLMLVVGGLHRDDHGLVARHVEDGRPVLEGASGQLRSMYHALAGWSELRVGRFDEARRHGQSALDLASEIRDPNLAGALAALMVALLELAQGHFDEAAAVIEPVLREPRVSGPTREDAMLTGVWGSVLVAQGRLDEAETVMAEAVRLAEHWRRAAVRLLPWVAGRPPTPPRPPGPGSGLGRGATGACPSTAEPCLRIGGRT